MPSGFVDVESGDGAPQDNQFGGKTPLSKFSSPPQDTRTVRQVRGGANPATNAFRRVSSSVLKAGGREAGEGNDVFGTPAPRSAFRSGRDVRFAPPTSTVQLKKFVHVDAVDDADMLDVDVTLRKEDYGEPGTSDYRKNMLMATTSLSEKFGVAKHKLVTHAQEGDQEKSAHIQQVIVGILHRVKEGQKRSEAMDWMDICTVSGLGGNLNSDDPRDWWDGTEINVWKDWDICTEEQIRRWQFGVNKYFSDGDRIASKWMQQFVYNSCTDSLRTAVEKKYEVLPANQRGGVIYLFYVLREMFEMSREVKEAMQKFLDIFKRNGVSRYSGENVLVVADEITGICKRLDAVKALTDENVLDVLSGLCICTNKRFRDTFTLLRTNAELNVLHNALETVPYDAPAMVQIECVLAKATDMYDKLCVAGIWNRTSKGGPSALNSIVQQVNDCWNCGENGHQSKACPKPKNSALWKKNYEAFKKARSRGGRNSQQGGGGGAPGGGQVSDYNRKEWDAQKFSMVDGKLHVTCKKCGPNTTHSTGLHGAWRKAGTNWKLSIEHPYAKECRRLGQHNPAIGEPTGQGGGQQPPAQPQPSSGSSTGSSWVSIDRTKFEQSLVDFERTSTDPNASQMSEMFRSLFLN